MKNGKRSERVVAAIHITGRGQSRYGFDGDCKRRVYTYGMIVPSGDSKREVNGSLKLSVDVEPGQFLLG
jgi:hypothetical protein